VSTWLAGARAGYGAVQLLRPAYSAEQLLGGPLDPGAVAAIRVLGARQLAQAAVSVAAPSARLLALGAGADGAHALSMAVLALSDRRRRRPALVSGLIAELGAADAEFADNQVAPPDEAARGQLLRLMASDAMRAAIERHFGVRLAFQNCHRAAVFRPGATAALAGFISARSQLLNQRPELLDC